VHPAPFDDEYTCESPSGARLVSTRRTDDIEGYAAEGTTRVYGADGTLLYEMPVFVGRRETHLSPDGSVVVLDGDEHFGTGLMRSTRFMEEDGDEDDGEGGAQVVASVYLNGELWRELTYEGDLKGPPVPADPMKEIGGGFAWRREELESEVDWEGRALTFYSCRVVEDDVEVSGDALPREPWIFCCRRWCCCMTYYREPQLPNIVRGETLLSLALPLSESSEITRSGD